MANILIADDEKEIVRLLRIYIEANGNKVFEANDGEAALQILTKESIDLAIVDIMMPRKNGYEIIKHIRRDSNIPILVISAKVELSDRVFGIDLGADDYIMKPFDAKELVARVKAVLRRYQVGSKPETPQADKGKCVEYPGIEINLTNYSVIVDGHTVEMPPKELELLYFLASSPNQVFTREQLLDQIWGYEYIGDTRTVDVHIKRLREKIKDHNGWSLSTVWGIGYKFEVK